jgi:UDP-N-acetylglucosamine--N-acetylmuramyl-(pentapeptide) pyrophosphoryl-undecaprenol N-acetylglucosamine transferase
MSQYLFVCSGGGHLKQLHTLARRIGIPPEDQFWFTFDNGLSRTLTDGTDRVFARFAAPRDGLNIMKNTALAAKIMAHKKFAAVISTGSSPAVSAFPVALAHGIPCHYIESAARAQGPSLTGKIVARMPRVKTYSQYPVWATESSWAYRGSIFDEFAPGPERKARPIRKAVVSLGTQESYGFDRLFRTLVPLLDGCEVLWQVGAADVSGYGIDGRASVLHSELADAVAEADVVVAHAGTGAALTAIEAGKVPVLVPRLARFGEHVDDHQVQIAAELSRRGLAVDCPPERLDFETLIAASVRTAQRVDPPDFALDGLVPSLATV